MRISDSKHIIDLSDEFDKIKKFFAENTNHIATTHIYDNGCCEYDYVLTAGIRNDIRQFIIFTAFETKQASDDMNEIFKEVSDLGDIGNNIRFLPENMYYYNEVSLLFPNTHKLAKRVTSYIEHNVEEMKWLMKDGAMYNGCELTSIQLLKMDDFFKIWESIMNNMKETRKV